MSGDNAVVITGVADMQRMLTKILPRHAEVILRNTVQSLALEAVKEAKKRAEAIRDSGTLEESFYAKKQKSPADNPVSILRVRRGGKGKPDGFYWRFIEYGTRGQRTITLGKKRNRPKGLTYKAGRKTGGIKKPSRKNRFGGRRRTVNVKPVAAKHIVRDSKNAVYARFPQLLPKFFVRAFQREIKREAKKW